MKFWKSLQAIFSLAVGMWATVAYLVGPSWSGMIYAALAGYFLGAALWEGLSARWRALFEEARDLYKEMADLNEALIENRGMLHFLGETAPPDLPDEHKPRLH